jgi:hypothetical protein
MYFFGSYVAPFLNFIRNGASHLPVKKLIKNKIFKGGELK